MIELNYLTGFSAAGGLVLRSLLSLCWFRRIATTKSRAIVQSFGSLMDVRTLCTSGPAVGFFKQLSGSVPELTLAGRCHLELSTLTTNCSKDLSPGFVITECSLLSHGSLSCAPSPSGESGTSIEL
jgi:hypothetical protein